MNPFDTAFKPATAKPNAFDTAFASPTKSPVDLARIGNPLVGTSYTYTKPPPTPAELKAQNLELRQAPSNPVFDFFKTYTPKAIQEGVTILKEGLVGKGQGVDFAGRETIDTGALGFLRPFGIGKSDMERFTQRTDRLVETGTDPKRAGEIAANYVKGNNPLSLGGLEASRNQRENIRNANYTPAEEKALKGVQFWENLDSAFGALDVLSLGSTEIAGTAIRQIARSTSADQIEKILIREIPELAGDVATHKGLSQLLAGIKNEKTVETVLNRVAYGYRGVEAGKGAETAVSTITKDIQGNQGERLPFQQLPGYTRTPGQAPAFGLSTESVEPTVDTLRQAKGLSAEDIMAKHPDIQLKQDVPATDIHGNKITIPEGEALTPYELKGNKVLLQDGQTYIVSKNQYQNIKGNAVSGEAKPFAPELKGTEETVKGGGANWQGNDLIDNGNTVATLSKNGDGTYSFTSDFSEGSDTFKTKAEAMKQAEQSTIGDIHGDNATKYSQYQLPDGKNYKEILIKAPQSTGKVYQQWQDYITELKGKYGENFYNSGKLSSAEKTKLESLHRQSGNGAGEESLNFKSSHWDEPNVISHLRLNERTYQGKKVTFMEELQSDLAREGRTKGFGLQPPEGMKLEQLKDGRFAVTKNGEVLTTGKTEAQALESFPNTSSGVPNLFKQVGWKEWVEPSVKRGLQEAVNNNSEYFSWINGEQTSARYNLSTQVKEVGWKSSQVGNNKSIEIQTPDGKSIDFKTDGKGIITKVLTPDDYGFTGKKLDEVLGKGLADKIMEKESGTLSGEGLKFGGEWANNLYDKQVGNIVSDLTGAKVEKLDLGLPIDNKVPAFDLIQPSGKRIAKLTPDNLEIGAPVSNAKGDYYIITDILGDGKFKAVPKDIADLKTEHLSNGWTREARIERAKQEFDISTKKTTQQGIKITPEIRAKIQGKAPTIKTSGVSPLQAKAPQLPTKPVSVSSPKNIIQRAKEYYKNLPNKQGGYVNFGAERVSEIDRLIADNKVRVVSRDGRDVYQVKKGNVWANARDESSAIKTATAEPVSKAVQLPQRLEEKKMQVEFAQEALDNNPAKQLSKYVSTRGDFKGGLKEVTGKGTSVFSRQGDQIAENLGFQDSEAAREAYDKYVQQKEDLAQLKAEVRKDEKVFRASVSEKPKPTVPSRIGKEEAQSLEQTAQQSLQAVPEPYRGEVSSLGKIVIDTSTSVKVKVGALDYLRTPDRVLQKIGLGEAAKALRIGYDGYTKELPKQLQVVTDWSKQVSKEGNVRIFKYLDGQELPKIINENGQPAPLSDKELQVAGEIKQYLSMWADRLNLPVDDQITHYVTHIFELGTMEKEFDEDIAKIIKDKVPGSVYDPFLEKRLGAKGYVQDTWRALDAYVKRAVRKANMDPALEILERQSTHLEESQYNYVQKLGARINMRPTEWDNLLDNTIKQIIGYRLGQRPTTVITSALRKAQYRGALGLNVTSAVKNLTQGVNTFAKLGVRDTTIGYIKLLNPGMSKELVESGVLQEGFIQDRTLSATRQLLQKTDKGLFYMFQLAEKINRGSAYFGAKAKAIRVGKTEEQAIEYAKKVVRDTQFVFGSIDTPLAMQGDIAKTLFQFGSFSQKQTEFLGEMIKNKEYAGIIRYILASIAIVYTVGKVFNVKGSDFNPLNYFSRFGQPPSLALPIAIFKAVLNVPNQYGKVPTTKAKVKDILRSGKTLIPAGVQLDRTLQGNPFGMPKSKKVPVTSGNPFNNF